MINLKFDTPEQAEAHLLANGWKCDDGQWFKSGAYHDIRFVQPMHNTGEIDEEENPIMEPVEGVHINILCKGGCCESNIAVETPYEVWA